MTGRRLGAKLRERGASGAGMISRSTRLIFGWLALPLAFSAPALSQPTALPPDAIETIVMVRHGEKPAAGLGQLNCQGLNRALALPGVLDKKFGARPVAIFAPNPTEQKTDDGILYDYIRPLATIEPAAIAYGLPVHADIGQSKIDELNQTLTAPAYRNAYVLVGWEHTMAMNAARALIRRFGGDPADVPEWKGDDFDSIYVVELYHFGPTTKASFRLDHEGLNGQKTNCPGAG
jgi:hypothetical protein